MSARKTTLTRAEIAAAAGLASGAKKAARTCCKRGHLFVPGNTIDTGHGRQCKECVRLVARNWRSKNRDKLASEARNRTLSKKYSLTSAQVDAMVLTQGGVCAICGTSSPGKRGWHVDHCHRTGVVRGALCAGCNTGIGLMRDSPNNLIKAAIYLLRQWL